MPSADDAIQKALNSKLLQSRFGDGVDIPSRRTVTKPVAPSTSSQQSLQAQIEKLKKDLIKSQNRANLLHADLKAAQQKGIELPKKVATLEAQVAKLDRELKVKESSLERKTSEWKLLQTDLKIARHELDEAKKAPPANNDTVTHLQQQQAQVVKIRAQLESKCAELEEELNDTKKNAKETEEKLTKQVENLKDELVTVEDALMNEKQKEKQHDQDSHQKIEKLEAQVKQLEENLEESRQQCQSLQEEKKMLQNEVKHHTGDDLYAAKRRAEVLEQEDLDLQRKVHELEKELSTNRMNADKVLKEAIEKTTKEFTTQIKSLEEKNHEQHVHILRLQREATHSKTAGQEKVEKERDTLKASNEQLKQQVEDLKKKLSAAPKRSGGPPPPPAGGPPPPPSGGAPPPPPPSAGLPAQKKRAAGGAAPNALFADINKGGFKLRKVPKSEQKRPVSPKRMAKQKEAARSGGSSGGFVPSGNPLMDELRKKQAARGKK